MNLCILTIFLPKYFIDVLVNVVKTCENEEEIAEAVDEGDHCGIDGGNGGECYDAAFGAAADGACYVCDGCGDGAAGEDEAFDGGEPGVDGVDGVFESGYFGLRYAGGELYVAFGVAGEVASDVEKTVLYPGECVLQLGVGCAGCSESDVAVEFVDGSVGFKSGGVFCDAFASDEGGCSGVACACVDYAFFHSFLRRMRDSPVGMRGWAICCKPTKKSLPVQ